MLEIHKPVRPLIAVLQENAISFWASHSFNYEGIVSDDPHSERSSSEGEWYSVKTFSTPSEHQSTLCAQRRSNKLLHYTMFVLHFEMPKEQIKRKCCREHCAERRPNLCKLNYYLQQNVQNLHNYIFNSIAIETHVREEPKKSRALHFLLLQQ